LRTIHAQIQIQHYNTNLNNPFTQLWVYFTSSLSKIRSTIFTLSSQNRSKIGFLTAIKIIKKLAEATHFIKKLAEATHC